MSKEVTTFGSNAVRLVLLVFVCSANCLSQGRLHPRKESALQRKLEQTVEFQPRSEDPLDQLVEAARSYEIPMGIEWREPAKCEGTELNRPIKATVRQLLIGIIKRCSDRRLEVAGGIVHIRSGAAFDRMNILNLRIRHFQVKNVNLFTAEHDLRLAIDQQLHPQQYVNGYNGGYGYGPGDVFAIENVTFSGANVSIRSILDGLAVANGNALWTVRLNQSTLKNGNLGQLYNWEAIVGLWHFVPLKE